MAEVKEGDVPEEELTLSNSDVCTKYREAGRIAALAMQGTKAQVEIRRYGRNAVNGAITAITSGQRWRHDFEHLQVWGHRDCPGCCRHLPEEGEGRGNREGHRVPNVSVIHF